MVQSAKKSVVLIGAGHTHALVLQDWARAHLDDIDVTVVDLRASAVYSGMLPGFVAGHYAREALDIDVGRLVARLGGRFIQDAAVGINVSAKTIALRSGQPSISFDVVSFDVGITSAMPQVPGFTDHGVPAKPLPAFVDRWLACRDGVAAPRIAVIGGGVAGVELAMAMAHALKTKEKPYHITVLDRGQILSAISHGAAKRIRAALKDHQINVHEEADICEVTSEGVSLADGSMVQADFTVGAAGAMPHAWLAETELELNAGYIAVNSHLQASDPSVFAAGDCVHFAPAPLPKAGVYAVRMAPTLGRNLLAKARGDGLETYNPQTDFLKLISLGGQRAVAEKFGVSFAGRWAWWLKNRIDGQFMDSFRR